MTVLMLLACVGAPAHHTLAMNPCYSDALGTWRGPVFNGQGIEYMTTNFTIDTDGGLVGSYHVEDAVPFDGTLTDFRETGPCSGDFRWHDRDGSGTVHINFQPERGRFLGRWGFNRPLAGAVFNGYRGRSPAVS